MKAIDTSGFEEQRKASVIEAHIEDFFKRWQPKDENSARFAAEFFMLVRRIHADAAEPYVKQMTTIMSAIPPIFPVKS